MGKKTLEPQQPVDLLPVERVADIILALRGKRVIIDADLARLYGVTTKRLNQQVRRNSKRFPDDFVFQLADAEKAELVANCNRFNRLNPLLPEANSGRVTDRGEEG